MYNGRGEFGVMVTPGRAAIQNIVMLRLILFALSYLLLVHGIKNTTFPIHTAVDS